MLLFGASGFLGAQVRAALERERSVEWVTCVARDRCDLVAASVEGLASLLRELTPNAVVNCTGSLDGTGYQLMLANTLVTAKLIDAVESVDPAIRLIRLGSAGEYGRVPFVRPGGSTGSRCGCSIRSDPGSAVRPCSAVPRRACGTPWSTAPRSSPWGR